MHTEMYQAWDINYTAVPNVFDCSAEVGAWMHYRRVKAAPLTGIRTPAPASTHQLSFPLWSHQLNYKYIERFTLRLCVRVRVSLTYVFKIIINCTHTHTVERPIIALRIHQPEDTRTHARAPTTLVLTHKPVILRALYLRFANFGVCVKEKKREWEGGKGERERENERETLWE